MLAGGRPWPRRYWMLPLVLATMLCKMTLVLHGGTYPATSCDTLALAGSTARAESCYAAAAVADPEDANVLFNWGVTTRAIAQEAKDSAEAAVLVRRAVNLYERAVALGGKQQIFLYALADAYCRLNRLDRAVEMYTTLDNWRRGLPYNVSSDDTAASISLAERAVRDNRAATTGDKLSKLSVVWEHRFSDDFRVVADHICEPDETAHLHALFQPDRAAQLEEPMSRWFYHTVSLAFCGTPYQSGFALPNDLVVSLPH
jgi:tetratricopeptide (TPR) repeat protein